MNFFSRFKSVAQPANVQLGRASRLPMKAKLSIKPGLDQVVKQRMTSVIAYCLMGECCFTTHSVEDLSRIDAQLNAQGRRDIYQVTLYGYELATLYSFLLEQEQFYNIWSPDHVPHRVSRLIRADLRSLLRTLHEQCRLQEYVSKQLRALECLTVSDPQAFGKHLEQLVHRANLKFPRCTPLRPYFHTAHVASDFTAGVGEVIQFHLYAQRGVFEGVPDVISLTPNEGLQATLFS